MGQLNLLLTLAAVLGVLGYYAYLWLRAGSHHCSSVVIQYRPPQELSPAMVRYIWKERFDDRTFWACILSLVSKGIVALGAEDGSTYVRRTASASQTTKLPAEELMLLDWLFHGKKRESLGIEDATTAYAIWKLAQQLRAAAVGKWFSDNRQSVITGAILSLLAVIVAANPQSMQNLGALSFGLIFMAPGGYYLLFVLLRLYDLVRALREHFETGALGHLGLLLFLLICCGASLMIGSAVLGFSFGPTVVVVTGILVAINVGSLLWLRMPTKSGQALLDSIEGFREYLKSVERLPMDKRDAPSATAGLYEKYLPYAVALEVEQSWSDGFMAAKSSYQEHECEGLRPFYLGMWDGKPVEVAFRANANGKGY